MPAVRLALFDLDGTLLDGDTDELWCEFLIQEGILDRATFGARNRSVVERYAAGVIEPAEFCAFYASTLAGRSASSWSPWRERFIAATIVPRLGPAAHALVAAHRDAGDRIVLTTATNRFLAEPIAALLGIAAADLIATGLQVQEDRFTGANEGVLNMREGKLLRLVAWLKAQATDQNALADATFYSDSSNDLPLLRAVGHPVVVEPDEPLREEAVRRGWPVIGLPR